MNHFSYIIYFYILFSFRCVKPVRYILCVTATINLYYNLYCTKKDGRFRMLRIRNFAGIRALKLWRT